MSPCKHPNPTDLTAGYQLCRECGAVGVDGRWARIYKPKPCCEDCAKRQREVADTWQREHRCAGCGGDG